MELKHLYRQIMMDHYKNPQNKGLVEDESYSKFHLYNPSCGDDITVQALVEDNIIKDIKQDGKGCSICCSSASVMSQTLKGKNVNEANEIIQSFYNMLMDQEFDNNLVQGEMLAYSGVKDFPARISCATLPWKALEQALKEEEEN